MSGRSTGWVLLLEPERERERERERGGGGEREGTRVGQSDQVSAATSWGRESQTDRQTETDRKKE